MPCSPFLSRKTDPSTSADAADAAVDSGLADSHEQLILAALRDHPHGLTGSEIANRISARIHTHVSNVQVMRRMSTLHAQGRVHNRPDPAKPYRFLRDGTKVTNHLRHGRELLHFLTRGDAPLFGE